MGFYPAVFYGIYLFGHNLFLCYDSMVINYQVPAHVNREGRRFPFLQKPRRSYPTRTYTDA